MFRKYQWVFIVFVFQGTMLLGQAEKKVLTKDSVAFHQQEASSRAHDSILHSEKILVNRHPQDSEVGTFEILNSNENFQLNLGGYVKMTMYYDGGLENNLFFDVFSINTTSPNPKGRLNFHAYETRLNTEVIGRSSLGHYRVYIEGDFLGGGGGNFRLRHAFGQFQNFIFGQTWSFFMDNDASPFTVDLNGPPGATFSRKPLVGYTNSKWIKNSLIGISVENPNSAIFATSDSIRPQIYPDIVFNYTFYQDNYHIKLATIYRSFIYENHINSTEQVTDGYGVMIGASTKLNRRLELMFQGSYGQGISEYLSFNRDLIASGNGDFRTPRTMAALGALRYRFNFRSQANIFYSFVELIDTYSLGPGQFKSGDQFNANYIFELSPSLKTGAEFIYGLSENIGGGQGEASRIYLFFLFTI